MTSWPPTHKRGFPTTSFAPPPATRPVSTRARDCNGDNKLDVVVNLNGSAALNIAHLINMGGTTFQYNVANNLGSGNTPYSLAMGDA